MMRASSLLSLAVAGLVVGGLTSCTPKPVPQHSGYKGKKPTPWTKAKVIELDEEFKAKAEGELDYGEYKRAKWFMLTLPGPGSLVVDLEVVPSGDAEMDVALEVFDKNFHVLTRADAEADDVNEQKKQRKLADLDEGTYYFHVYLEGRLDAAEFELKLAFARGEKAWQSDFPNQVAYASELPAVPPFDDTPAPKIPPKPPKPPPRGPRPPKPPPELPPSGKQAVLADITDVQPTADGSKLVIGAGTSDGVDNGMRGSVSGVKGGSFVLSGCNANRCIATVKAAPDDVRASGSVIIRP